MTAFNLSEIEGFDWDDGNLHKNWRKKVQWNECEEVFLNAPFVLPDEKHSYLEKRHLAFGVTNERRNLTIVFTIRDKKLRVISARDQNKRERQMNKSKKNLKEIPKFKNEDEEREFWAVHDTTEYFDTSDMVRMEFPNLKPSTKNITIRIPESLLYSLKRLANKRDIPYQSLEKIFLAERVEEELKK